MSRVFEVDPERPDVAQEALNAAAAALDAGELVVFPTETVYGIACRPDVPEATERLFAAKRRPGTLNLPILSASAEEAWSIGVRSDAAQRLADRFWPGALTMVLQRTDRSLAWKLGERGHSVGVRVPHHRIAAELLRRTGSLAVTSANVSGQSPLADRESLESTFDEAVAVLLVLPGTAPAPGGASSTILDVTMPFHFPRVIREGPIGLREIAEALSPMGHPAASDPPAAQ